MSLTDKQGREGVRDLNDAFRKTYNPHLGRIMLTAGVAALPNDVQAMAIQTTTTSDAFVADTCWSKVSTSG